MKTNELLEVEKALRSIGRTFDARYNDHEFASWSTPSAVAGLRGDPTATADRVIAERNTELHERAAIHYCLTSAAVLLGATRDLMTEPASQAPKDREERRRSLIDDIKIAAHSAYRAGFSLAGHDPDPPSH